MAKNKSTRSRLRRQKKRAQWLRKSQHVSNDTAPEVHKVTDPTPVESPGAEVSPVPPQQVDSALLVSKDEPSKNPPPVLSVNLLSVVTGMATFIPALQGSGLRTAVFYFAVAVVVVKLSASFVLTHLAQRWNQWQDKLASNPKTSWIVNWLFTGTTAVAISICVIVVYLGGYLFGYRMIYFERQPFAATFVQVAKCENARDRFNPANIGAKDGPDHVAYERWLTWMADGAIRTSEQDKEAVQPSNYLVYLEGTRFSEKHQNVQLKIVTSHQFTIDSCVSFLMRDVSAKYTNADKVSPQKWYKPELRCMGVIGPYTADRTTCCVTLEDPNPREYPVVFLRVRYGGKTEGVDVDQRLDMMLKSLAMEVVP